MDQQPISVNMDCRPPTTIGGFLSNGICLQQINASTERSIIFGILAGAYIAFGACLSTLIGHDAAKYLGLGLARFVTGATFSFGLMLVIVAGADLFTGSNLMFMTFLDKKTSLKTMIFKWCFLFATNFIGAVFLAYLYYKTNLWKMGDMAVGLSAVKIANTKVGLTFTETLTRGILCNWLVCLAIWMAAASRDITGKILVIFFPIMAFVALGFEHSVANMYFIPLGLFLKSTNIFVGPTLNLSELTWDAFFIKNLLPVTIGNIIGGAIFVGFLYWRVFTKEATNK